MNVVERFIHKFKQFDKSGEVVKTFTEGYCYYFACILCERFKIGTLLVTLLPAKPILFRGIRCRK